MRKWLLLTLGVVVVTAILASVSSIATQTRPKSAATEISYPTAAAHRGGAGIYPENTLTAFEAIAANHPGMPIEMDIRALKDGTLVVVHDQTVDRVAVGVTGRVGDMSPAQWGALRIKHPLGGPSAPASTLKQVLNKLGGNGSPLVIELEDETVADRFIESVWPHRGQVIVQSFNRNLVSRFAKSGLHTLQLSDAPTDIINGVEHVGLNNKNVTVATVASAHAKGVRVWVWGDDVTASMANTDTRGVDGFIVNDPTT